MEICKEVHNTITVQYLRSRDIRVTLRDQQAKKRAIKVKDRIGEHISIKVLHKDYLVKVLAVPLSLRVEKGH
jgi:hypothetical protein